MESFQMKLKIGIAITGMLLSSPSFAQSYNGFVSQPTYDFSASNMTWAYGGDQRQDASQVLAQLRALCSSTNHYDQYYCARGMKVLKKAYAEYKLRNTSDARVVP